MRRGAAGAERVEFGERVSPPQEAVPPPQNIF